MNTQHDVTTWPLTSANNCRQTYESVAFWYGKRLNIDNCEIGEILVSHLVSHLV